MTSIFSRDLDPQEPLSPFSLKRIEAEIAHLRKGTSTRNPTASRMLFARLLSAVALCSLLALFFMDPFVFAFQKNDAMKTYVYLHSYGSDVKARSLANSGIFSPEEIRVLNARPASTQAFESPEQANESADSILSYMSSLNELRSGKYDNLDPIGKLRYLLFVRMGLMPPVEWSALSPTVKYD